MVHLDSNSKYRSWTGIDVAADAISVDVSDFATNLANDRIVTGNGSDSMRGESNVTIDSSSNLQIGSGGQLTLTGGTNAVINVNSTADSFIEKDSGTTLYLANNVSDQDITTENK